MEYAVQKLAQMAGISIRTLRYYDELGILKPARINGSKNKLHESGRDAATFDIRLTRTLTHFNPHRLMDSRVNVKSAKLTFGLSSAQNFG